jgi:ABC-type branched-subunit amino acid transport system ATPase component
MNDPILETEQVTKRFDGLTAVDRVDLRMREGEIRAIVGPNGAGKTTLFNLISGLSPITAGRVRFRGQSIAAWAPHLRARAGLGRSYQTPQIFADLAVFDNVAVGFSCVAPPAALDAIFSRLRRRRDVIRRVEAMLMFVGLPAALDTPARELTFAGQKRLELARVLMGKPAVALLDEPAAGLNRTEVVALMELIRKVRHQGVTVCLIEHNMRLVMGLCDTVTVLDFGRKIAEGPPDEVRQDPAVIASYLGSPSDAVL